MVLTFETHFVLSSKGSQHGWGGQAVEWVRVWVSRHGGPWLTHRSLPFQFRYRWVWGHIDLVGSLGTATSLFTAYVYSPPGE